MKNVVSMLDIHARSPSLRAGVTNVLHNYKGRLEGHIIRENNLNKNMIYANNYLNYGDLKVVGFDLDYTLVSYTVELQTLIYNLARDVLVSAYGYPKDLSSIQFDPKFAIRGLTVDSRHGVLSKLSHLQKLAVNRSYRGKQQLSLDDIEKLYGNRHIPYGELSQMRPLNDLFSVAEGCLIADVMELFISNSHKTGETFVPSSLVEDVQQAISEVHINGSMQGAVLADPQRYIKSAPDLGNMLSHVRDSGKKLFLCTNSGYTYSNQALNHALGLQSHSSEWKDLFDVIICSAKKPDFYKSRMPFRLWDAVRRTPTTTPVGKLEKGQVYVQGSAKALLRATGWKGEEVLYLGDNLRTDLVEARRWHGWHTGCIINELESEVEIQQSPECEELRFLRSTLRNLMYDLQNEMQRPKYGADVSTSSTVELTTDVAAGTGTSSSSCSSGAEKGAEDTDEESCRVKDLMIGKHFNIHEEQVLSAIEIELQQINANLSKLFNPNFGSVFRTDGHPSLFAFAMHRYVDLYTSDVSNLLHYNPRHRFYPFHSMHMAHDPASLSAQAGANTPATLELF